MELLVDIEKKLGSFDLKVNFTVQEEILSLLGASGCGKSMTLKCIAGIEKPDKGRIVLNGKTLFDSEKHINLKPQQRKVGYLFQQYALFPNMTVEQNIMCAVRDEEIRPGRAEKKKRVADIIESMDLSGLEKRMPGQISGGQQQRVALARILVNQPDVMLLDEPFSALDAYLRIKMEKEVGTVVRNYGKPTIFVSHSRDEVFRISDRIAIMDSGIITKLGSRTGIFTDPGTVRGAILTGLTNISEIELIKDSNAPDAVTDPDRRNIPLNTVYAKDFGLKMHIKGDLADYTYIAVSDAHIKYGPELDHMVHSGKASVNTFLCDVIDTIENPGNITVTLREVHSSEGAIVISVPWSTWRSMNHEKVKIHIFPVGISLLK